MGTRPIVIFDIDGTLLDSAAGIVAGYQFALASVDFPAPSEQVLRADLGPPVRLLFARLGVTAAQLDAAVASYHSYYVQSGFEQASIYPGVSDLLTELQNRSFLLATATAKRTPVAEAFLAHHGLADFFDIIGGTDEVRFTKTETITQVLDRAGQPDPSGAVMIGDRHSDITGALDCGVRGIGVTWGYGTAEELLAAGAAALADRPRELSELLP